MTATVVSVVGARPQFVKAAPVSRALRRSHREVLVHTGQHYDEELSDVFFEELSVPEPAYDLGVGSGSHAGQTAEMMVGLHDVVEREAPDAVLVYGDTNSTLAGALVAAKSAPRLVHVEAGLRSNNWSMPEEVNRVLTDHCADLLFVPTETAVDNLRAEGVTAGVHRVGDVMYDALLAVRDHAVERSTVVERLGVTDGDYVLATVHRAGNTDDPDRLAAIVSALAATPREVVFPAHPRTVEALEEYGLRERASAALTLADPVGYVDFVRLLDGAAAVATDSGGVQKEAFYLDTPCVTLRNETEWVETVESGWNRLVGADEAAIRRALDRPAVPDERPDVYGDGNAADRIARALAAEIGGEGR
ncbi:MAG: non-hydrolyzing UDP-N-acetylglucosamine 2-epimerase [Haloferacaceae archaeon]